jgi:NAD/NADP transhydrogenase beta subunit
MATPIDASPQQQAPKGAGLAIAGMVLGILAVLLCWFAFVNWVLAILAIIFGAVGIARANKGAPGKGMAITGLVCGAVGFIAGTAIFIAAMRHVDEIHHELQREIERQHSSLIVPGVQAAERGPVAGYAERSTTT